MPNNITVVADFKRQSVIEVLTSARLITMISSLRYHLLKILAPFTNKTAHYVKKTFAKKNFVFKSCYHDKRFTVFYDCGR
mgnify:CR=1 FL=1